MKGIKKLGNNPASQIVEDFRVASNAYAEQLRQRGEKTEFLTVQNSREVFKKLIKASVALANPANVKHKEVFNSLKSEFGGTSFGVDYMHDIGSKYLNSSMKFAQEAIKSGMASEEAVEYAFNSLAGNPVFDHFGNLNLLGGQLYQEQALLRTFLESGDAFAVPVEGGSTGTDRSRFRAPVEQVTGSAKVMQGDINPKSYLQDDNNRTQISLYNEFKDAITLDTIFSITQSQRDQTLGYEKAISPALAGFILQNRYFESSQKQVMRLAELMMAFGHDGTGKYTPNIGGNYGLLSASIHLSLASAGAAAPLVAEYSDWVASENSGKLLQKITNYNYALGAAKTGPFPDNIDPSLMYKDITRLFSLAAQQNVDFMPKKWVLFVPTSWYSVGTMYPGTQSGATGQGTFNKQLDEMVRTATGQMIKNIEIVPSSLMNYGASNGTGGTNAYNYMVAMAMGCEQEKKPVILPGQTALPFVVSENVSASIMNFRTQYVFGGPMVMHYGGAFVMEFSV